MLWKWKLCVKTISFLFSSNMKEIGINRKQTSAKKITRRNDMWNVHNTFLSSYYSICCFFIIYFFLFWVNLFSDGNGQRAKMSFQRIYYVSFIAGFDDGVIWSMIVTSLWTSFKISCPTKLCPSHLIKLSNWKKRWFPYCSASLWSYSLHVIIRCYTHLDGTSWPK